MNDSVENRTEPLITKVPGMEEGASYVPVYKPEQAPDPAGIARARREAGRKLYEIVSAKAVKAAEATRRAQAAAEK